MKIRDKISAPSTSQVIGQAKVATVSEAGQSRPECDHRRVLPVGLRSVVRGGIS